MRTQKEAFEVHLQESTERSLALADVGSLSTCRVALNSKWTAHTNIGRFIDRIRADIFFEIECSI
jgi:hypothetical protein